MNRPRTRLGLGTAILVLSILVLGLLVAVQHHRETRLKAALEQFRVRMHAKTHNILMSPRLAMSARVPLGWGGEESLDAVLGKLTWLVGQVAGRSRLILAAEIDPGGLKEAGKTRASMVKLPPPPTAQMSVDELLTQVLEPNNLAYQVRDGVLTITSRKAVDRLNKSIRNRLEQPVILTWAQGGSLEQVLERVRTSSQSPSLPSGLMTVLPVRRSELPAEFRDLPDPVETELPYREHLRRILEPLGLQYVLRNGAVVVEADDAGDQNG
jgi:hypothetical protein